MPAERDPRVDPRPGDVLRKGKLQRTVVKRDGHNIIYEKPNGQEPCCWITTWRDWARNAEVVSVWE